MRPNSKPIQSNPQPAAYQIPQLRDLFGSRPPKWIRDAIGKDVNTIWPGEHSTPMPAWVDMAEQSLFASVLPDSRSTSKMSPVERLGFNFGILNSFCRTLSEDMPMSPAASEHLQSAEVKKSFEEFMRLLKISKAKLKTAQRQYDRLFKQCRRLTQRALDASQERPFAESQDFLRGYTAGSELLDFDPFNPGSTTQTQKTLALLIMLWPLFNRFSSVATIHGTLRQANAFHGDLKSFEKITASVGLRLRPRGRPRKQNIPPT